MADSSPIDEGFQPDEPLLYGETKYVNGLFPNQPYVENRNQTSDMLGNYDYRVGMNTNNTNINYLTTAKPAMVTLSRDMIFNDDNLFSVIGYSILFVIAACGNLTVFITLFRNRHRRSRVNMFIMHLCIADMVVAFIMLPLEIAWHITVAWKAGDVACRIFMYFRAFGFYLSSFILITISLDRYFAILHPLSLTDADKRGKLMLLLAWLFSLVATIPQSVIFHVETHPTYKWFSQCVTFHFFPTAAHELAYNLFNMVAVYVAPLIVIIISYALILCEMSKKTREGKAEVIEDSPKFASSVRLTGSIRRSGIGRIERARVRTLKMTIVIVLVFILCWTPYFVISAWYWFDHKSAEKVNPKIQKGLFLWAVSNSCMDPIVYGMFTTVFRRTVRKYVPWFPLGTVGNGMFTINFEREFKRCCCCLRKRLRQEDWNNLGSALNRHQSFVRTNNSCLQNSSLGPSKNGGLQTGPPRESTSAIVVSSSSDASAADSSKLSLSRQPTPPHIAVGRGHSKSSTTEHLYVI